MACQDCVHFQEAHEKFPISPKHIVFKCPATGEELFANWDFSCRHFHPIQPDDHHAGEDT